jgi:succinate dehydrogenase/fumarate reductase flavoprotein subunit
MATRAGISTINAEFLSNRLLVPSANYSPNYGDPKNTVQPAARIIDGEGNVLVSRDYFYDWEELGNKPLDVAENRRKWMEDFRKWHIEKRNLSKRIANGEGPFYLDMAEATDEEKDYIRWSISNEAKGTQFLRYFEDEEGLDLRENAQEYAGWGDRELAGYSGKGIWVDSNTETEIRNLFAGGDEIGGVPFQSAPGALAIGWYAGDMAAGRAWEEKVLLPASDDVVKVRRQLCHDILTRKKGFYWKEVELYVQHVIDFYCGSVRGEGLLKRGLERLEYARQHGAFRAENPHELARALEVMSIIDNAELVFRSSIERKESRPSHGFLRSDYLEQNDKQFFAFLAIKKENGRFIINKKPVG